MSRSFIDGAFLSMDISAFLQFCSHMSSTRASKLLATADAHLLPFEPACIGLECSCFVFEAIDSSIGLPRRSKNSESPDCIDMTEELELMGVRFYPGITFFSPFTCGEVILYRSVTHIHWQNIT